MEENSAHPKNQLAAKLKDANNVLVTVSTNPSVDQLSAAIGLTLFLTKLGKHATTVFSGEIPKTIDFLKPEETIEDNTDSLRDFIIALDKSKADKIRYKVEDSLVKIFITPYRTSISEPDLVFSQGDFNVDVVVGLGVQDRDDIDQAIMAHGRILHDAVVATVNTTESSELGTLNWSDPKASSLCEMVVAVTEQLKPDSLDGQMATAFLTGVVAETERFSNSKTSSTTMSASAKLMAAGANQQLVATSLQEAQQSEAAEEPRDGAATLSASDNPVDQNGSLHIAHTSSIPEKDEAPAQNDTMPIDIFAKSESQAASVDSSFADRSTLSNMDLPMPSPLSAGATDDAHNSTDPAESDESSETKVSHDTSERGRITEPPQFDAPLSGATDDSSPDTSPLDLPRPDRPIMSRSHKRNSFTGMSARDISSSDEPSAPTPPEIPVASPAPAHDVKEAAAPSPDDAQTEYTKPVVNQPFVDFGNKTLDAIEETVDSHHKKPTKDEPKLPPSFAKTLDDKTLDAIEETVDSTHKKKDDEIHKLATEQVAKAVSNKPLSEIERQIGSPHAETNKQPEDTKSATVSSPVVVPPVDELKLDYEAIDSEPEEKSGAETSAKAEKDDKAPTTETTPEDKLDEAAKILESSSPEVVPSPEENDSKTEETSAMDVSSEAAPTAESPASTPKETTDEQYGEPHEEKAPETPSVQIDEHGNLSFPNSLVNPNKTLPKDGTASPNDDAAPPPVPPPMMPPS